MLLSSRSLELFVDAVLLQSKIIEVGYYKGENKYTINGDKVEGFGKKWWEFKRLMPKADLKRMIDGLDRYVSIRNKLITIHGISVVNESLSDSFDKKLMAMFGAVQNLFWPKEDLWSSIYLEFESKINFDFFDMAVRDVLAAVGLTFFDGQYKK